MERIKYLKRNLAVASKMLDKHYPEYESVMYCDVSVMQRTWYARYRKVFNRLDKELTERLIAKLM